MTKYIKKEEFEKTLETTIGKSNKQESIILEAYTGWLCGWVLAIFSIAFLLAFVLLCILPLVLVFGPIILLELWITGVLTRERRKNK